MIVAVIPVMMMQMSLMDVIGMVAIPTEWIARVRESMARLTPRFSASRSVREYTQQHYLPAASAYRARPANQGAIGRQMVD